MFWTKTETTKTATSPATSAHKQATFVPKDEWYVGKFTDPNQISVYLVNDFHMGRESAKHGVKADKAILFGILSHDDPDFEVKWATLLKKANRRAEVLNRGLSFTLEEVDEALQEGRSLCGSCNEEFAGEDYLCPKCREKENALVEYHGGNPNTTYP